MTATIARLVLPIGLLCAVLALSLTITALAEYAMSLVPPQPDSRAAQGQIGVRE